MSHANIFVLKRTSADDVYDTFKADEDQLAENLSYCTDYVTEQSPVDYEEIFSKAFQYLTIKCGGEQYITKTGPLSFKLTRRGIVFYFEALRIDLIQMAKNIENGPIDLFINNTLHGWWTIKELIETDYDGLWKFEDFFPLPLTSFLQKLYILGEGEYELELIQAFDYHY